MGKIKNFWGKLKYWKKGVYIGALLGLIKIPLFVVFGENIPKFIGNPLFKIPDELICKLLNIGDGEPCGFFVFLWIYL